MARLHPVHVFVVSLVCATVSSQSSNSSGGGTSDVTEFQRGSGSLASPAGGNGSITLPGGEVVPGGIFLVPDDVAESGDCLCVPFPQCDANRSIITTGELIFDVRIDDRDDVYNVVQCPDPTMLCCKLPPGVTAPPRPQQPQTKPTPPTSSAPKCGVRQSGSAVESLLRIRSGEETEFGEFPWMLALMSLPVLPGGGVLHVFECGASLIHPQVALTAAHCISVPRKAHPTVGFKVRAGEWDTNSTDELFPHQDRNVEKIIMREGFNKASLVNDIALLVLTDPFDPADNVGTVCLPGAQDQFLGAACVATGWGKEAFGVNNPYQTVLRKVDLQVTPFSKCQEELRKTKLGVRFKLNPSFMCADGKSGADTCKGDGGGPLACQSPNNPEHYVQVGIVSWGVGCGNGTPAVYTDVSYQRSWIDEKLTQEGFTGLSVPKSSRRN